MKIQKTPVWLAKCTLASLPKFIVPSDHIVGATIKASRIVHGIDEKATLLSVDEFSIFLVDLEDESGDKSD